MRISLSSFTSGSPLSRRSFLLLDTLGPPFFQSSSSPSCFPACLSASPWRSPAPPESVNLHISFSILSSFLFLSAFPANWQGSSCRQAAVKGCHNPAPCWTHQILARPNQPWARNSVFVPPLASRGHWLYIVQLHLFKTLGVCTSSNPWILALSSKCSGEVSQTLTLSVRTQHDTHNNCAEVQQQI